jgi:hypothetical protein
MHSGHMLLEGTWPDHVRVNMDLANVHVMQIVYGKSWREELSKELTDTYHGFPRSPLR